MTVPLARNRSNSRVLSCLALLVFSLPVAGASSQIQPAANASSLSKLQAKLNHHFERPEFATSVWGVRIVSLETGEVLFEQNSNRLLQPASNAKLFVAAAALHWLGPNFRIRTSLHAADRPNSQGVVKGDLIVVGRGDPGFSSRLQTGDRPNPFDALAGQLAAAGVQRITGRLVADESFFRGPAFGSGWSWDDLVYSYGAATSALSANDNTIHLIVKPGPRVGAPCAVTWFPPLPSVTIVNQTVTASSGNPQITLYRPPGLQAFHVSGRLPRSSTGFTNAVATPDPAELFLHEFSQALAQKRIRVQGGATARNPGSDSPALEPLHELASVSSRPLSELVSAMLKESQNLYAQLLLLQLGEMERDRRRPGLRQQDPAVRLALEQTSSEELGIQALRRFLNTASIPDWEVFLEEGAGLSRANLVTPRALVSLLRFMATHPHGQVFRDALPVAGVDGTLRHRMAGTAARGRVQAKTGSMRRIETLSGYVQSEAKERFAFAILLNNYGAAPQAVKAAVDAVPALLAQWDQRTGRPRR